METNLVVRTKIRVNGNDYANVEEMPPKIRAAYERALASLSNRSSELSVDSAHSTSGAARARVTGITFNGQTYASADEMPADARALYTDAIAMLAHESAAAEAPHQPAAHTPMDGGPSGSSIQPQSVAPRLIILGAAIILLALLAFGRLAILH